MTTDAATSIDLNNVQEAMNWLSYTDDGAQTLRVLAQAVDTVRGNIPTPLNPAETRYVLERLMSQRRLEDWDTEVKPTEVAGYALQQAGALPSLTSLATTPSFNLLSFGFTTRLSAPASRF
jgi:hypothetical protein